jgi:glycosyltransferase involved in cell wall biosynthesis
MKFSIIIPAHNEEKLISKCLTSIIQAKNAIQDEVEIVVVLNRCSDKTLEVAEHFGAITVFEDIKNLSRIRNAGVDASSGDIIVTIDADSWMKSNMLKEIKKNIETGKYIGGGVQTRPERFSLGILLSSMIFIIPIFFKFGISLGSFWCLKRTFLDLNGFNENLLTAEDVDFAIRLKKYGKEKGRRFKTINTSYIVTSCRKFDIFGDWYLLKNRKKIKAVFESNDREIADKWWYEVNRE